MEYSYLKEIRVVLGMFNKQGGNNSLSRLNTSPRQVLIQIAEATNRQVSVLKPKFSSVTRVGREIRRTGCLWSTSIFQRRKGKEKGKGQIYANGQSLASWASQQDAAPSSTRRCNVFPLVNSAPKDLVTPAPKTDPKKTFKIIYIRRRESIIVIKDRGIMQSANAHFSATKLDRVAINPHHKHPFFMLRPCEAAFSTPPSLRSRSDRCLAV